MMSSSVNGFSVAWARAAARRVLVGTAAVSMAVFAPWALSGCTYCSQCQCIPYQVALILTYHVGSVTCCDNPSMVPTRECIIFNIYKRCLQSIRVQILKCNLFCNAVLEMLLYQRPFVFFRVPRDVFAKCLRCLRDQEPVCTVFGGWI
jgi:hypothetical protein